METTVVVLTENGVLLVKRREGIRNKTDKNKRNTTWKLTQFQIFQGGAEKLSKPLLHFYLGQQEIPPKVKICTEKIILLSFCILFVKSDLKLVNSNTIWVTCLTEIEKMKEPPHGKQHKNATWEGSYTVQVSYISSMYILCVFHSSLATSDQYESSNDTRWLGQWTAWTLVKMYK